MKTIGIIGGMSWESTSLYYQTINQLVKEKLGGLHSAKILLTSVDFAEIEALQHKGDWQGAGRVMQDEALKLARGGADFIVIATNTMHKLVPDIESVCQLPIVHIADATAQIIQSQGIRKVGFIGTRFSMEEDFYTGRLKEQFGLEVIIPNQEDRDTIHNVIYEELCQGKVLDSSRNAYLEIIQRLKKAGAECVIEGCTEITMLVKQEHTDTLLFDTTYLHAVAAVEKALL